MKHITNTSKKAYIEFVLGACNRRQLDAQNLSTFFEKNGYKIISSAKKADIILLVTCAVSLKRENQSIGRIKYLKKFKGELIICGCLPGINKKKLSLIHDGMSIPTSELTNIDNLFPHMKFKYSDLDDANCYFPIYK